MGRVNLKARDLNRFRKTYPYARAAPKYVYFADANFDMESANISFSNSDTVIYTFLNTYTTVPSVTATIQNDSINVFIKSISLTQVEIGASIANSEIVSIVVVTT